MTRRGNVAFNEIGNAQTRSNILEEKKKAFLKQGGKIEKIPTGKGTAQNISYFGRSSRRK